MADDIYYKKTRVLMPVLHYAPVIGGLEAWTKNIAQHLSKKAEVFVITGKVRGEARAEKREGVNILRTGLFSLTNLSRSSWPYILSTLPFLYFKSAQKIKREKINLLHCQGFLSGLLGYFLSQRFSLLYIITVQSREKNKSFLRKKVFRSAALCIASSRSVRQDLIALGAKEVVIIPNGIDLSRFQGQSRQESRRALGLGDEFVVMTVARLEKVKGLNYLIEAADILVKEKKTNNLRVIIVGSGSQRPGLEKLVGQLALGKIVIFLGERPPSEIPHLLKAADCFCLPSLSEGFGIVILEAMASGLAIVASKVGGVVDLIEHERTGLLTPPAASEAIAKAVYRVFQEPSLAQEMAIRGKERAALYSWPSVAQKVFQVYQRAV